MSERMEASDLTSSPPACGKALWAGRLRRFGQGGLTVVLLVIAALWMHELLTDPAIRQGWKLKVLMALIPLGVLASLSLGVAWALDRMGGEKR
ncbi:MAG: hypothetical protein ABMA26_11830 [Limisphaerales bacterium]